MSDEISNKVISIFQKHRRGESLHFEVEDDGELIISPDGFNYVSLKHELNGHGGEETALMETAHRHYIIKMIEVHQEGGTMRLNNYYVPGDRLQEFLLSLPNRPGKVLEIKPFIPDGMA